MTSMTAPGNVVTFSMTKLNLERTGFCWRVVVKSFGLIWKKIFMERPNYYINSDWFCVLYFITEYKQHILCSYWDERTDSLLVSFNSGLFFVTSIGESLIIWKIRIWFIVEQKSSSYSTIVICIELSNVNFYFKNGSSRNSKVIMCKRLLCDLSIEEPFISWCKVHDIDHRFRKHLQS